MTSVPCNCSTFSTQLQYLFNTTAVSAMIIPYNLRMLTCVVENRAEEYFMRAAAVEPKDAEALNKYATFLWQARNDIWGAEQTYQAAMDADPNNPFYPANYAHFLWNTGGEDTCFPLETPDA